MRAHVIALAAAATFVSAAVACNSSDSVGSDESNITEWATSEARNEAYTTQYVIAEICSKLYGQGHQAESCKTDHAFTLVETRHSTKYGYLKAIEDDIKAPIEVGQSLKVTAPNDATFSVKLLRQLDEAFHLRWTVLDINPDGIIPPPTNVDDHIIEIADYLGEYVDFDDHDDVQPTTWDALPEDVQLACESEMLMRAEMNSEGDQCYGSADMGEAGEIFMDGNTVGYVCGIDDVLEACSIWDGSGVWLFLDASGYVVTETEWAG